MIRKFRENDLPSIMQIWFDSNVEVHSFIPEKYWMDNFEIVKDILPQAEIYVYENLGKISGFIGLNKDYIEGIFVEKNMRSKGIGKQLLNYVKKLNAFKCVPKKLQSNFILSKRRFCNPVRKY